MHMSLLLSFYFSLSYQQLQLNKPEIWGAAAASFQPPCFQVKIKSPSTITLLIGSSQCKLELYIVSIANF